MVLRPTCSRPGDPGRSFRGNRTGWLLSRRVDHSGIIMPRVLARNALAEAAGASPFLRWVLELVPKSGEVRMMRLGETSDRAPDHRKSQGRCHPVPRASVPQHPPVLRAFPRPYRQREVSGLCEEGRSLDGVAPSRQGRGDPGVQVPWALRFPLPFPCRRTRQRSPAEVRFNSTRFRRSSLKI